MESAYCVRFFGFHQSNLMADVLGSKPRPRPTTSFPIHHSIVILSLDATFFTCASASFRKSSHIHAYPLYGTCHVSTFKFTIALKIHTYVCGVTPCSLVFRPMFQGKLWLLFLRAKVTSAPTHQKALRLNTDYHS
jgi:hypothetical protein